MFSRVSLVSAMLPFILGFTSLLPYLTVTYFILFVGFYHHYVFDFIDNFKESSDPWFRVSWGIIGFTTLFAMWFYYMTFGLSNSPYLVLVLALAVFFNWQNRIIDRLSKFPYIPILKSDTRTRKWNFPLSENLEFMVFSALVVIVIIIFNSFVGSQGTAYFSVNHVDWIIALLVLSVHVVIHFLVVDQIDWIPDDGITSFKSMPVPDPPGANNLRSMGNYVKQVKKLDSPPEGFFEWIDTHLEQIIKQGTQPEYALLFQQIVVAFSYWGEQVRDKLHYLHLLVMAALRRFYFIGKVPIYNRYTFFSYLELLYKHQCLDEAWEGLIEFAMVNNDYGRRFIWIVDQPWSKEFGNTLWISFWNSNIFKGKEGYVKIADHLPESSELSLQNWEEDIWCLSYQVIKRFVGPDQDEEEIDYDVINSLDFLARKQLISDYEEYKEEKKKDLSSPRNRLVDDRIKSNDKKDEGAGKEQMLAFLSGEKYLSDTSTSLMEEIEIFIQVLRENLSLSDGFIPKVIALIVLGLFNMGIFYLIIYFFGESTAIFVFTVEFLLVMVMVLSGEPDEEYGNMRDVSSHARNSINNPYQLTKAKAGMNMQSLYFIVYFVILLVGFLVIFNQ